ncbi:MAG: hypothetical protein ACHQ1D_00540 [Nitrososphaerales archaeon]
MSEFIFPNQKTFPISTSEDIKVALENYEFFKAHISYPEFIARLRDITLRLNLNVPLKTKQILGIYRENRAERPEKEEVSRKPRKYRPQKDFFPEEF